MSDTRKKNIIEGMKKLMDQGRSIGASGIVKAKVLSTSDNLVQCEVDGVEIPDVLLRPVESGSNMAVMIVPKKGSYVLIAEIDRGGRYVVVGVDQAEKVLIKVEDYTLDVLQSGIELNGSGHDGLVKVKQLVGKLNNLENRFNTLLQMLLTISVPTPTGVNGAFPFAPIFSSLQPLMQTQANDLQNPNVKHG